MSLLYCLFAIFAVLGALDKILNNRFGLGKEFEKGFMFLGPMALTMIGALALSPIIAKFLTPLFSFTYDLFKIDSSIIPAFFLANDMGAASLCKEIAQNETLGGFNGLIVSTMMGVNISYTIPVSLSMVKKEHHKELFSGYLYGLATVPIGCFAAGLILKINIWLLLFNLLPLIIFAIILALGLKFKKDLCIKIFEFWGKAITVIITFGLALVILQFLTGKIFVSDLDSYESAGMICLNAAAVLAGAFPLMHIISIILKKPFKFIGNKTRLGQDTLMGFLSTSVSCLPTFALMDKMSKKGIVLNSAFIISASFTFGAHIAFTMAFDDRFIFSMIIGKLVSGICAVTVASYSERSVG